MKQSITAAAVTVLLVAGTALLAQEVTYWKQENEQSSHSAFAKMWNNAESDEERQEVKDLVYGRLDKQFEMDMERREKELQEVEARLGRLRKQLARRAEKKDDILQLQLNQMTNAWEGLGWVDPTDHEHVLGSMEEMLTEHGVAVRGYAEVSDNIHALIAEAADSDNVSLLAKHVVRQLNDSDPMEVNNELWTIYTEYRDKIEDRDFWLPLAKAAAAAAEDVDDDGSRALILDTIAHLYHSGGKIKTALKYQTEAVEASGMDEGDRQLSGTQAELKQFLDQLRDERDGSDDDREDEE